MPEPEETTWFEMFVESFEDTTVQILMAAAVISLVVGMYEDLSKGWIEGTTILMAVVIVAVVTATNNFKKEAQFRSLNTVKDKINVSVIRNGSIVQISTYDVVVGDIVSLNSGDKIPADGIILSIKSSDGVQCNESAITGESEDKVKTIVDATENADPFLLSGTTIASGTCTMLAIAVGPHSRWGKTKAIMPIETPDTPLQEKLDTLANQIGNGGMIAAAATFIAMLAIWFYYPSTRVVTPGESFYTALFEYSLKAFIMAVTIVVVAVPEGLPLAVTVSLAYSTSKMMKDNNLIRVLSACETMGNATNICSDKTGTLTQNKMTVVSGYVAGTYYNNTIPCDKNQLKEIKDHISQSIAINTTANILFNNESPVIIGNRTEAALLWMIYKQYDIKYTTLRENGFQEKYNDQLFSFTSTRKRMSVLQMSRSERKAKDNHHILYVKGASEVIVKLSKYVSTGRVESNGLLTKAVMNESTRKELLEFISTAAKKALRCIALAHKVITDKDLSKYRDQDGVYDVDSLESELVLDGIYCISDPIRPDVPAAIKQCHEAGVVVRMITGDNVDTATAIAKECGILTEQGVVMDGPTFRQLTPSELDAKLENLQVLARSTPMDKYNLVSRLNGQNLPETKEEWEAVHVGFDNETYKDKLLPGMLL